MKSAKFANRRVRRWELKLQGLDLQSNIDLEEVIAMQTACLDKLGRVHCMKILKDVGRQTSTRKGEMLG